MKPPVPGVDASRKLSGETQTALPVVLMTCSRVMPLSRSCVGVDLDLQLLLALAPDGHVGHTRERRSAAA